jgi:hypothetical protein
MVTEPLLCQRGGVAEAVGLEAFKQLDHPTTPFGRSLHYVLTAFD